MAGVNKVILVGNLGKDPEIRYTAGGTQVANFSIATTDRFQKDGQTEERTEWHNIVAFGRLAEICGEYLRKGKQVYIEGRLQTRSWEDREGNKRYTTEIIAREMQMLGRRDEGGGGGGGYEGPRGGGSRRSGGSPGGGSQGGEPQGGPPPSDDEGVFQDDDIPF